MTFDKNKRVRVTNRTNGSLAYYIDTLRVTRRWRKSGDYLNISIGELLELKTAPGGMAILSDSILIEDEEALSALFPDTDLEPEYHYGLKEVQFLLYEGTTEQLLDALDYAPKGVIEMIRREAIKKLPNTTSKVKVINERFEIDLNTVFELNKGKEEPKEESKRRSSRRAAPVLEEVSNIKDNNSIKEEKDSPTIPKYNVIRKEE